MTETTETERRVTVRPGMALATRNRPRGMWGQITTSVLRPGLFYRTLLPASETRQWLWAAILILALVGIATVRYSALTGAGAAIDNGGMIDPGMGGGMIDPGMGGDFGGMIDPGMGGDFGMGGMPNDPNAGGAAQSTLTADLTMALLAGSNIVLGWVVLTVMLIVVPMLRGRAPKIGQNLQIAIWSSLPLAIMAVVQLIYYAAGGQLGEPGVQGMLNDFPAYATLDSTTKALLISFTSRLTVFWLWTLLLVYFGARFALGGWRIVAFLIVIAWAGIQIVAPVVTETITAPVSAEENINTDMNGEFGEFPPDMGEFGEAPPDGEIPSDTLPEATDDLNAAPETNTESESEADPEQAGDAETQPKNTSDASALETEPTPLVTPGN